MTTIKEKLGSALRYISLTALPHGVEARVVAIEGSGTGTLRLMEMGLVPGASISVVRTAPLGDPLQICLRNHHLALRRVDAEKITVLIGS
ncbi:MAG: FeoA family protein [Pyrinomonadaceae bacterium]